MIYDLMVSPERHIVRAKKKGSDYYIEGYYVQMGEAHCLFTGKMNSRKPFSSVSPEFHEINPYTVLHCVGFRDEDLTLIFESDIIYDKLNDEVLYVSWNQSILSYEFTPFELDETERCLFKDRYDKKKTLAALCDDNPAGYFANTKILGSGSRMTMTEIRQLLLDINTQKQENITMR